MLPFQPPPPTTDVLERLRRKCTKLAGLGYEAQVEAARDGWSPSDLGHHREVMRAHRPRKDRCVYCEDNEGDEVDHVRPRTLHPLLTWDPENLICACGTCGGGGWKGAREAIIDPEVPTRWREVSRLTNGPRTPPACGKTAWWNPRLTDPLVGIWLDIEDKTFLFEPYHRATATQRARAAWTIDVLGLNRRTTLLQARKEAYRSARSYLREWGETRPKNPDSHWLVAAKVDRPTAHPTVWAEMKRQQAEIPELRMLFEALPEALTW